MTTELAQASEAVDSTTDRDVFLQLKHIDKSFSGVHALRDVSMKIMRGRIHCLVGENGCGKSTLIKVTSGVYQPDAGAIVLNGKEYTQIQPITAIREGIQVIYQDFSLFPNLTVAENIALNEAVASGQQLVSWRRVRQVAADALAQIDVTLPLNALVSDVSVANKQLIAISKALRQNAQLIIMDEPTSALTEREVRRLFEVIHKLQAKGIAFLFVSHKLNEVLAISETVYVMRNGRMISTGDVDEYDQQRLTFEMTGQEFAQKTYEFTPDLSTAPLLAAHNLKAGDLLKDISLEIRAGEIVGVTGLLGSGRTELALALFGVLPLDSGEFSVDGVPVQIHSIQDAIAHGIGYVPEDRLTEGLFLERSIGSNVVVRTIDTLRGKLGLLDMKAVGALIDQWISGLRIKTSDPELPVRTLSGGNQQRVVLAKWLASHPKVMILNGPTMGVDIGSKNELHELIKELAGQGMGLLVISDDLPELLGISNRILFMRNGAIEAEILPHASSEEELSALLVEVVVS